MNKKTVDQDTDCVFVYAVIPKHDWHKVTFPEGSMAAAYDIGPLKELANLENCKGWGSMAGIALGKLGLKLFPEIHKIVNAAKPPMIL